MFFYDFFFMDSDKTCFQNDRNNVCRSKFEDRLNRFKSYGQKCGQIWVCERFFEKITRNMTDTETMMMTNIIGNFIADNIVIGMEVLAHHPEELSLEIWEFTNLDRIS